MIVCEEAELCLASSAGRATSQRVANFCMSQIGGGQNRAGAVGQPDTATFAHLGQALLHKRVGRELIASTDDWAQGRQAPLQDHQLGQVQRRAQSPRIADDLAGQGHAVVGPSQRGRRLRHQGVSRGDSPERGAGGDSPAQERPSVEEHTQGSAGAQRSAQGLSQAGTQHLEEVERLPPQESGGEPRCMASSA